MIQLSAGPKYHFGYRNISNKDPGRLKEVGTKKLFYFNTIFSDKYHNIRISALQGGGRGVGLNRIWVLKRSGRLLNF